MNQKIEFYKYHGTGNDFILINSFQDTINLSQDDIQKMCHRQFGIGADGLMILRKKEGYDFEMDFYNSDGKPGSMCGNGGRCIVSFAHDLGIINKKTEFLAPDGSHQAIFNNHENISLKMIDVDLIEKHELGLFMDTGSPHLVIFRESENNLNVFEEGRKIRYSKKYLELGVNVNFIVPNTQISKIFTYERGVENQTFSCGTGTVASAIALNALNNFNSPINFQSVGGNLTVHFDAMGNNLYQNIWLEGPAFKTFNGNYYL